MKDAMKQSWRDIVLAGWAFLESIAWFIAADYPLFLRALREDDWERMVSIVILGSGLGIAAHYALFAFFPATMETVLLHTPFVQDWMLSTVKAYLAESWLYAVLQPYTLIAVKTWTYTVFQEGHSFFVYLPLVMIGRATRWGLVVGVAKALASWDQRFKTTYYYYVVAAWTTFFAAVMLIAET